MISLSVYVRMLYAFPTGDPGAGTARHNSAYIHAREC